MAGASAFDATACKLDAGSSGLEIGQVWAEIADRRCRNVSPGNFREGEHAGILLGRAIRDALGTKKGIDRFASTAPLDESLAEVSLDLSGRSFLSFRCAFTRERVGEFPTELVEDFFCGFVDGLGATLHIRCRGRNDHHKIEAIFKSVALALRSAIRIDRRTSFLLPTTKGVL